MGKNPRAGQQLPFNIPLGDPEFFKFPKESLYKMMKEVFKLTDDDFKEYSDDIGFEHLSDLSDHPVKLAQEHLDALKAMSRRGGLFRLRLRQAGSRLRFHSLRHSPPAP